MKQQRMNQENTMSILPTSRAIAAALGSGVLLIGLTGCGSGAEPAASTKQSSSPKTTQSGGGRGDFPGASGEIAAVDGSTAQVQSQVSGQVAVSWTGSTDFTKQVAARLADVKVGDCVMVASGQRAGSDGGSADSTVAATTVRISEKTDGSCAPGGPGGGPGGAPDRTELPEGATPPDGGDQPRVRSFGGAFGEVTAVSASGFTVDSARPGSDNTASTKVTVRGTTTYSQQAKGAASDVKVGGCMTATGKTDDTGAITATAIQLSPAENGECGGPMMVQRGGPPASTEKDS